jgi:hypothetical protein
MVTFSFLQINNHFLLSLQDCLAQGADPSGCQIAFSWDKPYMQITCY